MSGEPSASVSGGAGGGARRLSVGGAVGALVGLTGAIGASAVLTVSHLPGFTAPGCGAGGGCDKLKTSMFGVVPGTGGLFPDDGPPLLNAAQAGWPTAYLGLAYFVAMAAVLLLALRTGVLPWVRWVARLGAVGSVGYIGVMLSSGTLCPWCFAAHVGNFVFLGSLEFGARSRVSAERTGSRGGLVPGLVAASLAFALASVGAGYAHNAAASDMIVKADEGVGEFIEGLGGDPPDDAERANDDVVADGDPPAPPPDAPVDEADAVSPDSYAGLYDVEASAVGITVPVSGPGRSGAQGFTGRYLMGPEVARARIVVYASPLCPHCRKINTEAKELVEAFPNQVSFSVKHFPLNSECNPLGRESLHRGSCQAAYTIETAGYLGGPAAFWAMSEYFYDRFEEPGVRVEVSQLNAFIRDELGMDTETYREAYGAEAMRAGVAADIREGVALGITATPAVLINGQIFEHWHVEGALTSAVTGALDLPLERLPFQTAAGDRAPTRDRVIWDTWRRRAGIGTRTHDPSLPSYEFGRGEPLGPNADGILRFTVFNDYGSERSRRFDREIRGLLEEHPGVLYQPRVYPMSRGCNPFAGVEESPNGCRAARAFVTAREFGSEESLLVVHDWLFDRLGEFTDDELRGVFTANGIDADEALAFMGGDVAGRLLLADAADCHQSRARMRAPVVFLNGRPFMVLESDGDALVDEVLRESKLEYRRNPEVFTPQDPRGVGSRRSSPGAGGGDG